jgi:hypothetical protein
MLLIIPPVSVNIYMIVSLMLLSLERPIFCREIQVIPG